MSCWPNVSLKTIPYKARGTHHRQSSSSMSLKMTIIAFFSPCKTVATRKVCRNTIFKIVVLAKYHPQLKLCHRITSSHSFPCAVKHRLRNSVHRSFRVICVHLVTYCTYAHLGDVAQFDCPI